MRVKLWPAAAGPACPRPSQHGRGSFDGQQLSDFEDATNMPPLPPDGNGGGTPPSDRERGFVGLVKAYFSLLTMAGCVVGGLVGWACREGGLDAQGRVLLGYPGELFVRALKAPLSPLIFASMINCCNVQTHASSASAPKYAVGCYALTTVLASATGVVTFALIRPGSNGGGSRLAFDDEDSLSEIVPSNMLKALVEMQLLSIITSGIAVGIAIRHTARAHPEATAPMLQIAQGTFESLLVLISWLVLFAPIGVSSMVAACVAATPELAA
ncbi:Sodium:dicarboxylate symporter, partial [Pavlovales sp. CCMP2436]